MEFYPYQMNQTLAAKYCNVSISEFKKEYRPHVKQREKGGFIYFLKKDLEKHIRRLFNEKVSVALPDPRTHCTKPKLKIDPFEKSLENLAKS